MMQKAEYNVRKVQNSEYGYEGEGEKVWYHFGPNHA